MNNTWEVYAWKEIDGDYQYVLEYSGNSRRAAMNTARKLKKDGCGCIKIEWRPYHPI